ncbi:MAG: hypothetical protein A4E55_01260 [Pelotomaculum sp. PtaU1.Bin035]|nr:MAG: hypothetical protein A4E55_01260 [Pelotomaculum sp. PtaU1.Bin035]
MDIEVIAVSKQKGMQEFNTFPRAVYRDSFMAPSFPMFGQSQFSPLFGRIEAQPFLAVRNGHPVGRVAASVHSAYHGGKTGFFGYFESLNDPAIAAALINAAVRWLSANGISRMIGPVDLTPHERLGLLAEGFSGHHHPGTPHNPPYYANLLAQCGLETEINLYAYHYDLHRPFPERLKRVANRAGRIKQLRIREINFNNLAGEGEMFSQIHNSSMNEGWGFVPLSPEEGSAIWQRLKGFSDPGLILIAEICGNPAGLCLALYPTKKLFFLHLTGQLTARLAVLAVPPRYRFKGLEAALILECLKQARRKGISSMELSLIAENNPMMNRIIQNMGGIKRNRLYRIYRSDAN